MAKHQIATTSAGLGRFQFADRELAQLITSYKKIGDVQGQILASFDQAVISLKNEDFISARIRIEMVLKLLAPTNLDSIKNQAKVFAARVYLALGDVAQAEKYYAQLNGQWNDIRPSYVLIGAHILHDKGELVGAVTLSRKIKLKLKANWTEEHEQILQQFIASEKAGKILKMAY